MKQQAFSVLDCKTGYFNVPYFSPTILSGRRSFQEVCRDANSLVAKYPDDFQLWHVGEFDDVDGHLTSFDPPGMLCTAREYVLKGE